MRRLRFFKFTFVWLLLAQFGPNLSSAEAAKVRIVGRETATVTTASIKLSDIADVSSKSISDDDVVIGLKKVFIEQSPAPGQKVTLGANTVIARLESAGVNLSEVGYLFPRNLTITRAARALTVDEVKAAIEMDLREAKKDATLKSVNYRGDRLISPGNVQILAQGYNSTQSGQTKYALTVTTEDGTETKLQVDAQIDEWREVPVAKRSLERGAVIADDDVMMARMNLSSLPQDATLDGQKLYGKEIAASINYGEVFRRNKLFIPATVNTGDRVTMVYRTQYFEASATGISLEPGIVGQRIKVRNDNSKKVVQGPVLESGIVQVSP